MPPTTNSGGVDGDYFNDLMRQPSHRSGQSDSATENPDAQGKEANVPRPKRIACIICRKRKLKCDGNKPSCGTCSRLGHKCAYDEVRRKSGPKRGYVKELEARLAQVEARLKSKGGSKASVTSRNGSYSHAGQTPIPQPGFQLNDLDMGMTMGEHDMLNGLLDATTAANISRRRSTSNLSGSGTIDLPSDQNYSWEVIGLGLEEPLPRQDMIEDLQQIYFDKIHPSVPMIHRYRYLAAMNLAPHMRPPVCLRYAMWALASSVTEKYIHYQDVFYLRARKYAELDEMKGHGEAFITVGHSQCWTLLAMYELKMLYFPRAWMSNGRSIRLAQMMGLHRLDGKGLEVKQCLPQPRDWTDREERRRTFWAAYCGDRYASIGTGWPMMVEEKDIMTNLPAADDAFEKSKEQSTMTLTDAMTPEGAASLSSYAGVVLMACLFGQNLTHLHRPDPNDRPEDPTVGEFWKRHNYLDGILENTSLFLPQHLRLPAGVRDANIVFLNMNIHTSTICLHQAAILKAEKHKLGPARVRQSLDRCSMAAAEIVSIMRLISHIDIGNMNPFISFCLYVAARIFIHAYKKSSEDQANFTNLEFLLNAMQTIKKKNPLTESFLIQLMVDLEGTGIDNALKASGNHASRVALQKIYAEVCGEEKGNVNITCMPRTNADRRPVIRHSSVSQPLPQDNMDLDVGPPPQYNVSSFNVPTRERQYSQSANPYGPGHPSGVMMRQGFSRIHDGNVMNSARPFEMEIASDCASDRQNSLSGHPTPVPSHHSSNTSYSPTNIEDPEHAGHHDPIVGTRHHTANFYNPPNTFNGFPAPIDPRFQTNSGPNPGGYGIPHGWDVSPDGIVLPSVTTGMSPMGETGWSNMLDNLSWDAGQIPGEVPWRPSPSGSRV